ncbi:MAG: hypothetical protein ACREBV_08360, partial [Candidatus Zixiibacteriota bacterium]
MRNIIISLLAVVLMAASAAVETVPQIMSYQGRLIDASGTPANGSFDMTFRIYDSAVGGNLLWEEVHPGVFVTNGLFNAEFRFAVPSSTTPVTFTAPGSSGDADLYGLFLELTVEAGALPIQPRTRLLSSPFSMLSYGLAGDIFTSPGHVYLIPNGPPVSESTYVPLELAVDSLTTRIRLKLFNPAPPPPSELTYA